MSEEPQRRRRWPRRVLVALGVIVLVLVALFYGVGGWYFSSVIRDRALSGAERRASLDPSYDLVVSSVGDGSIVLHPTGDPPSALDVDGTFGLRWEGGYGHVGEVTRSAGDDVTRSFFVVTGTAPEVGAGAQLDARAYADSASAGVRVRDVTVSAPIGDLPAWYVRPSAPARDTWVVIVHGNSMSRLDNVRVLAALRDAGYPTLSITYRNDEGAPEDPSGLLRYGLTEWEDLEAAVRYATAHGADGVVLYGDSMGGGVIAAFLQRSSLAGQTRSLVLDAPMLNFSQTVDDNASREPLAGPFTVPSSLTAVAKWFAHQRFGVDWADLEYLQTPEIFDVPTLVFHGDADTTVPIATSEELADMRPDTVTLVRCSGADHIECWNLDPNAYASSMLDFLAKEAHLGDSSWAG
jgi:pimeloyl-ACP methyl ester carboxylesterase